MADLASMLFGLFLFGSLGACLYMLAHGIQHSVYGHYYESEFLPLLEKWEQVMKLMAFAPEGVTRHLNLSPGEIELINRELKRLHRLYRWGRAERAHDQTSRITQRIKGLNDTLIRTSRPS